MTTNRKTRAAAPPRSPGRPAGSPNVHDKADVEPSRCQKCRSSKRGPYKNTTRRDFRGSGSPFVAILYRRCQCLDCGQWRIDRTPEYEGEAREEVDSPDQGKAA